MDNEIRVEDEISLADIFGCLLLKIRLIIVLFLVGILLGGTFGFLTSYNVVYYGTEMSFFVSPEKENNEGEDDGDNDKNVIYGTYGDTIIDTMIKYLGTEKAAEEYVSDMEFEGLPKKPDPNDDSLDLVEYTKQVKAYNELINKVKSSLTFSFRKSAESKETDYSESKNFIYVELSVQEEGLYTKEFTAELLRQLQVKIPKIVKATMLNPDENKYVSTGCTLVTPLFPIVECMNESYALKQTIKYAALAGLAVGLLTCIAVVVIDRLDKRVRETEMIEKRLAVPVLGVIPSILPDFDDEQEQGGEK